MLHDGKESRKGGKIQRLIGGVERAHLRTAGDDIHLGNSLLDRAAFKACMNDGDGGRLSDNGLARGGKRVTNLGMLGKGPAGIEAVPYRFCSNRLGEQVNFRFEKRKTRFVGRSRQRRE